ncbi:recombinase family protein [Faecalispora anaeroviscerum]|uniref:recombinase family protein n=1 Tax=Faecalispora anaeroviscerum TaxID=2991836 RepID=UPI0024BAF9AB|nr:recombinase family protein [Faecalispora anaeroviscerum]
MSTKSISRFGGDTIETLSAINRLKAAGVRIIFEEENLDTDEVDSNLMISVMKSLAQAENESRSENIRMVLAMRAANGTSSGQYRKKERKEVTSLRTMTVFIVAVRNIVGRKIRNHNLLR